MNEEAVMKYYKQPRQTRKLVLAFLIIVNLSN